MLFLAALNTFSKFGGNLAWPIFQYLDRWRALFGFVVTRMREFKVLVASSALKTSNNIPCLLRLFENGEEFFWCYDFDPVEFFDW